MLGLRDPTERRRLAEQVIKHRKEQEAAGEVGATDHSEHSVRELQVRQVELELQCQELQEALHQAEVESRQHLELYGLDSFGFITLDVDGLIVRVNPAFTGLFGIDHTQLIGRNLGNYLAGADRLEFPKLLTQAFLPGDRYVHELTVIRSDARRRCLQFQFAKPSDGRLCHAVVLDITERKQAEERFRLVIESVPNGILVVDQAGQITMVNAETERLFGRPRSELIANPVEILIPCRFREQHPDFRKTFMSSPSIRTMGAGRDVFGLHKDGREFPVEIGLTPIVTTAGVQIIASIIDITERQRAEEQAATLRDELTQVARLGVLGEMAAGLAHELNQPLSALHLYASAAQQLVTNQDWKNLRDALRMIGEQALRAGEIVRRMRSFVRRSPHSRSLNDLNSLIRVVLQMLGGDLRHNGVHLDVSLDETLPEVVVDGIEVQQVLVNLIRNAVDALSETQPERRNISIRTDKRNDAVRVSITDSGGGVDASIKPRLFQPFQTTKSSGLGLGLAICRTLIENHGGQIDFFQDPDRRTTFYFDLPISERSSS